jgi:hypothetical protein
MSQAVSNRRSAVQSEVSLGGVSLYSSRGASDLFVSNSFFERWEIRDRKGMEQRNSLRPPVSKPRRRLGQHCWSHFQRARCNGSK